METATDVVQAGLDAEISAMDIVEIGTDVDGICTDGGARLTWVVKSLCVYNRIKRYIYV